MAYSSNRQYLQVGRPESQVSSNSSSSNDYPRDPSPAPPYDNTQRYNGPYVPYGPTGPSGPLRSPYPASYSSHTSQPSPSVLSAPSTTSASTRLPFFEAALARSRGEEPVLPESLPPSQPLPTYLPPMDPNHPSLNIGMTRAQTYRPSTVQPRPFQRNVSRSPSPEYGGFAKSSVMGGDQYAPLGDGDEKGLLNEYAYPTEQYEYTLDHEFNDEKDPDLYGSNIGGGDITELPYGSFGGNQAKMTESATQHFGPAPQGRVGRRTHNAAGPRRIKQTATLDQSGFFAVDMPIPTRLAQFLPFKGVEEQKSTRYTAITSDPDDVVASGFRLRQNNCSPPRQTELFIVITMYNEDAVLFCRTLYGVMKNISHLCGRKNSKVWGKDGWQKIVVCIVADGRKAVDPRVLDCLSTLGVFQEGAMTSMVKDKPVTAHVFEYTTSFALDPDLHFKYPDKGIVPCQIIFCMKEKNARKINSHRWFFNAFAPLLNPNVCILLDVGTRPEAKSLYHLWKAFDVNSKVGGACGEIATFKGKTWRGLLNPLVAAQCFEYKMSNILDKPMESLFGYVTVLPGAFSAYRWIALQNNPDGTGPLSSYFQGESLHTGKADTFTANMYLAEDRILCFEIVAKSRANWILKFVKSAVGETDCPDSIPEFIGQRRRWLNGSFFAAVYSLIHVAQVWRSGHSFLRKFSLMIESVYNTFNLFFGWFSLANFYIFFVILTSALEGSAFNVPHIQVLNKMTQYGYLGAIVACFIFSMGNRPQGSPWKYKGAIYFFAILTLYMMVCAILCIVQAIKNFGSASFARMVVSLCATYGIYLVSSILALDPWHMLTCFPQFILFSPTYINVLNIYAYSNLHDLSWGTKGVDNAPSTELGAVKGVGNEVEVALVSSQQDIDMAYQTALDNIRLNGSKIDQLAPEDPKQKKNKNKTTMTEQQQKDVYANFRTNLLLLWALSNGLLASIVLSANDSSETFSTGQGRAGTYMLIVLVLVAGMAFFRFICSTIYLIIRLFGL